MPVTASLPTDLMLTGQLIFSIECQSFAYSLTIAVVVSSKNSVTILDKTLSVPIKSLSATAPFDLKVVTVGMDKRLYISFCDSLAPTRNTICAGEVGELSELYSAPSVIE